MRSNNFKELPASIWPLTNLESLNLIDNPIEGESKKICTQYSEEGFFENNFSFNKKDIPNILEFCRIKGAINIFLSHAVIDFDKYGLNNFVKFLEEQAEIDQIFYCEKDLKGNIDVFMNEYVPKSNLILFIATNKSIFNSQDCLHELKLAKSLRIPIIPIKGYDIEWDDLASQNLNREHGLEFQPSDSFKFYKTIYNYIKQYKRKQNFFDLEEEHFKRVRFADPNIGDLKESISREKIIELLDKLDERLAFGEITQEIYENLYKKWQEKLKHQI